MTKFMKNIGPYWGNKWRNILSQISQPLCAVTPFSKDKLKSIIFIAKVYVNYMVRPAQSLHAITFKPIQTCSKPVLNLF